MNKELLAFSVAGLRLPADNEEGLAGPFRTVSALMKALEEPELDLLKEKYFVLKAKAEKIKAIEKATDEAIDAAQISPKIGDPKIDRDGELECSCNFLTKELQALYADAESLLKEVNEAEEETIEILELKLGVMRLISFFRDYFEKVQKFVFLIHCHDAAVEEPIKSSSNPLLAQFL